MDETIKIKTGSRISMILQSTVTYSQAFTELVKNAIQNGATFVDIQLNEETAAITDNGVGFDHHADDSGMTGFNKYFVFGNSYDISGGAGPNLGHMGVGGKIANDKLSDSNNVHWTIETKNQHGSSFMVTYAPEKVEFLDEYEPQLVELSESSISTDMGSVITIHNLDKPILKNGWDIEGIKKELQNFFGYLVRNGETDFNIILNGQSLEFNYTLSGYVFSSIDETFEYEMDGEVKTSSVKFNLTLVRNKRERKRCNLSGVAVVSDVKICNLTVDKLGGAPQKSVRNLFDNLRGFVVCDDLSSVLDHTGMPAKDLSHHALRGDHPITLPFYEKVASKITELLRGYLLLNVEQTADRLNSLAINVVKLITKDMDVDENLLVDLEEDDKQHTSAKERMEQANISADIVGNVISAEVENKTKHIRRRRRKSRAQRALRKNLTETPTKRGIRYEMKPFGMGREGVMSEFVGIGRFCVYINSENHKFVALDKSNNNFGLALHIAESIIRELMRYKNPFITHDEICENLSEFYQKSYAKLKNKSIVGG